jgi:hypothetical protein
MKRKINTINFGIYFLPTQSFLNTFIYQRIYRSLLAPGLLFSFVIFLTQTVGLLGRGISQSQGLYLHTGQHKHRINTHTDIHALNGIRNHDPSVRASKESSYLRSCGHCDRLSEYTSYSSSVSSFR